jgi:CRISPR-associated protein Cas2
MATTMQGARWWLICHDVRDPKRLRKTAKHMDGYGERMQYSVFRCWLTPRQLERLRWELTELLKPVDDVLFIPLCATCVDGITATHSTQKEPNWPGAPPAHVIV